MIITNKQDAINFVNQGCEGADEIGFYDYQLNLPGSVFEYYVLYDNGVMTIYNSGWHSTHTTQSGKHIYLVSERLINDIKSKKMRFENVIYEYFREYGLKQDITYIRSSKEDKITPRVIHH